jgi:hypothetical protein
MVPTFKLVLIGDGGVGKSALVKRHVSGDFDEMYAPTKGAVVRRCCCVVCMFGCSVIGLRHCVSEAPSGVHDQSRQDMPRRVGHGGSGALPGHARQELVRGLCAPHSHRVACECVLA